MRVLCPRTVLRLLLVTAASPWLRGQAPDGDWRAWESAKVHLHLERMALIERTGRGLYDVTAELDAERAEVRACLDHLRTNAAAPHLPGLRLEAYRAVSDGSAQPFWRYVPAVPGTSSPPLLVYLHGYVPTMDLHNLSGISPVLTNLAERTGACAVAPFGRSNTDYQGIGEQDVLRVIDEMARRHGADRRRVILVGSSMGGMGAWCMGARYADRFAAILVMGGRADFYVWHRLKPSEIPPWQRRLIDTQFATMYLARLREMPLLAAHGMLDDIVTYEQGIFPVRVAWRLGASRVRFLSFREEGHGVCDGALYDPRAVAFLEESLRSALATAPPLAREPGFTGSRLQDALLAPFLFVGGMTDDPAESRAILAERAANWLRFAKGLPPRVLESDLTPAAAAGRNLFVFGEPEQSPLVRAILDGSGASATARQFLIAGRSLPRINHGLWFTGRNPFDTNRTAVVQCGIPWGAFLPENHYYDRIPDVIVYREDADDLGVNLAAAAGFLEPDGTIRWYDPPVTPAITRNALQAPPMRLPTPVGSGLLPGFPDRMASPGIESEPEEMP